MAQLPEPIEQLKDAPLRFLETEQFQEMLSTYQKLKPLEKDHPRKFKNQMNTYDFADIYPLLDSYLQTHDLATAEAVSAAVPEPKAAADTLPALDRTHWPEMPVTPTAMSLYALPCSDKLSHPDWHRLWINTALLSGAFVGTLLVLECLPEGATNWNRDEIQSVPLFTRWYNHVIRDGPEWDGDKIIFNYVLHPYAGAVYFMAARSCGFNYVQSMVYSTLVSTIGWEFGIEAFMERPSLQDLFITPLVGSLIGEAFYRVKRHIVERDYTLAGSRLLGNVVCFLVDPVNEFLDLFRGSPTRRLARNRAAISSSLTPSTLSGAPGFTLAVTF